MYVHVHARGVIDILRVGNQIVKNFVKGVKKLLAVVNLQSKMRFYYCCFHLFIIYTPIQVYPPKVNSQQNHVFLISLL